MGRQILRKDLNIRCYANPSSLSRSVPFGRMGVFKVRSTYSLFGIVLLTNLINRYNKQFNNILYITRTHKSNHIKPTNDTINTTGRKTLRINTNI
jgi:hypothetical protein